MATKAKEQPKDPIQAAREAELEYQEGIRKAVAKHNAAVRREAEKALEEKE